MLTIPVGFMSSAALQSLFGAPDFTSAETEPAAATLFSFAHSLGQSPDIVTIDLIAKNANNGYAVGDVAIWNGASTDTGSGISESGTNVGYSATDVFVTTGANRYEILTRDTRNSVSVTSADWAFVIKAWIFPASFTSGDFGAINFDTKYSTPHGLGSGPKLATGVLECIIAEDGYSVGDHIFLHFGTLTNSGTGASTLRGQNIGYNDTDIFALIGSANYFNKNTGENVGPPSVGSWEYKLKVWSLPEPDFKSTGLSVSAGGSVATPHGMSLINFGMSELVNVTPEANWSAGDRLPFQVASLDEVGDTGKSYGGTSGYDIIDMFHLYASDGILLLDKNTPATASPTIMDPTKWELDLSAWGDIGNIGSILPKNLCDIDATFADSYDGSSQTFANRNPAPFDASAQTDWDLWRGVDGGAGVNDPVFTGGVGAKTGRFLMSVTDKRGFQMKNLPAFLTKIHRNSGGQDFTIALAGNFLQGAGSQTIFGNNAIGASEHGIRFEIQGTGALRLRHSNGTNLVNSTVAGANTVPVSLTDQLIVLRCSFDMTLATNNGYAVNADTFTGFSLSIGPDSTDATNEYCIGMNGPDLPGATWFEDTSEIRAVSIFSGMMTDGELAFLRMIYNARHNNLYV